MVSTADSTYAAWLGAMNFNTANAERTADSQIGRVQRRIGFETPFIQEQGRRNLRGVSGQMENRGLTRSGEHLRRRAESASDTQEQLARLNLSGGEQIGGISDDLATQLARLQLENANQQVGLSYRMAARG